MASLHDRIVEFQLKRIAELLERILATEQASLLVEIEEEADLDELVPASAKSAVLTLLVEGENPEMPATIHLNGNGAQATFTEFDLPGGTGNVVPPVGTVSFTSSDTTVATVDANGRCAAIAAGAVTITGTDSGNGLTASDSLTVTADVAQSATLALQAL